MKNLSVKTKLKIFQIICSLIVITGICLTLFVYPPKKTTSSQNLVELTIFFEAIGIVAIGLLGATIFARKECIRGLEEHGIIGILGE